VHLGLLAFLAAALGTLQLLHIHIRNAIHADVGLAFAGLVVVHLLQRRHRIARMLAQLMRFRPRVERELRFSASDAILTIITINVVVSGILDWDRGAPLLLPSHSHSRGGTWPRLPCSSCTWSSTCRAAGTPPTVHDPIAQGVAPQR